MQELARSLAHARGELKRLRADMTKFKAQERHRMKVVEDIVNNKQISIAQIEQIKSGDFEPLAKKSKILPPETDVDRKLKLSQTIASPIGHVVSPFLTKSGTPHQPGQLDTSATIKLSQGSTGKAIKQRWMPKDALEGLEEYSHCWIVFHFHLNDPESNGKKSKVSPPRGGGTKVGIFASRAPYRPSPIGLSLVEIARVDHDKGELVVKNCDLVHETPVLDIKPYIPDYDKPGDEKEVKVATWLEEKNSKNSEIKGISFTSRADIKIQELISVTEYDSAEDLKSAITKMLMNDPRSIYRKTQLEKGEKNKLFFLNFSNLTVTVWFDGDFAEVLKVEPYYEHKKE